MLVVAHAEELLRDPRFDPAHRALSRALLDHNHEVMPGWRTDEVCGDALSTPRRNEPGRPRKKRRRGERRTSGVPSHPCIHLPNTITTSRMDAPKTRVSVFLGPERLAR
jgi:hypothetical protein